MVKCIETLTMAFSEYKLGKSPQIDDHILNSMIEYYEHAFKSQRVHIWFSSMYIYLLFLFPINMIGSI